MELAFALVAALIYLAWLTDRDAFLWVCVRARPRLRLGAVALGPFGGGRRPLVGVGARRLGAPVGGDALGRRARAARARRVAVVAGGTRDVVPAASRGSRPCSSRCCSAPGTYLSVLRLPHVHDLWTTGYGHVLLVKLGLVVARARVGRGAPLPRGAAHRAAGRRRGRSARTLVGESAVAMAVLLAAAILTDSKPPPQPPTVNARWRRCRHGADTRRVPRPLAPRWRSDSRRGRVTSRGPTSTRRR